jgi:hypothetical protein
MALCHWAKRPITHVLSAQESKQGIIPILTSPQLAGRFWLTDGKWLGKVVPRSEPTHRGTRSRALEGEILTREVGQW